MAKIDIRHRPEVTREELVGILKSSMVQYDIYPHRFNKKGIVVKSGNFNGSGMNIERKKDRTFIRTYPQPPVSLGVILVAILLFPIGFFGVFFVSSKFKKKIDPIIKNILNQELSP